MIRERERERERLGQTWKDRGAVGEKQENESAWTEKKQSESTRGYQWEDDGYISSPQPGQVCL